MDLIFTNTRIRWNRFEDHYGNSKSECVPTMLAYICNLTSTESGSREVSSVRSGWATECDPVQKQSRQRLKAWNPLISKQSQPPQGRGLGSSTVNLFLFLTMVVTHTALCLKHPMWFVRGCHTKGRDSLMYLCFLGGAWCRQLWGAGGCGWWQSFSLTIFWHFLLLASDCCYFLPWCNNPFLSVSS